jgi:hypothetical protein
MRTDQPNHDNDRIKITLHYKLRLYYMHVFLFIVRYNINTKLLWHVLLLYILYM